MNRRTLLAGSTAALAAGPTRAASAHPDAALIAACVENGVRRQAYNVAPDDGEQLWDAYIETHDFIAAAEPQTFAGVIAKARAAKDESVGPGGREEVETGCTASAWAWDVLNDLLRLAGERMV